jgi:hypothetical protein
MNLFELKGSVMSIRAVLSLVVVACFVFPYPSAFASGSHQRLIQKQQRNFDMYLSSLKELEAYVAYYRNEVETSYGDDSTMLAMHGLQSGIDESTYLSSMFIQGSGATKGEITLTVTAGNAKGLMPGSDEKTITLTPVQIGGSDIIEWACETSIPNYEGQGIAVGLLTYLAWPLSECTYIPPV